jgi:hypothetical protein
MQKIWVEVKELRSTNDKLKAYLECINVRSHLVM